jgi:hypothetical protein
MNIYKVKVEYFGEWGWETAGIYTITAKNEAQAKILAEEKFLNGRGFDFALQSIAVFMGVTSDE